MSKNLKKRIFASIAITISFVIFLHSHPLLQFVVLFFIWTKGYKELTKLVHAQSSLIYIYLWGALAIHLQWILYEHTPLNTVFVFLIAALHDIGGYITGNLFGSSPLYKDLSPKKTIEGFIGSIIFVYCGIIVWNLYLTPIILASGFLLFLISIMLTFFALAGDLIISLIKRNAKVKNTGDAIPGHGGVLDRLDSSLLLTWILYFFL